MQHQQLYHTAIEPLSVEMGERVGNYVLIEEIGRGGSGVVWLAVQEHLGREVALKVLGEGPSAGWGGSSRRQARFHREVEIASMLDHPYIAHVYDSGFTDGVPYLVMEHIDGKALDTYVEEAGLDQREILSLIQQVAEGVQHAHQRGVIHRDLKPSNILVNAEGRPRILDFGLAKALDASQTEAAGAQVSFDGELVGTPAYMAPEQAEGQTDAIDTRVDVYALGVILYQLLTGRFPHDPRGSSIEVLRRIAETDVQRPSQIDESLRGDLEALLLKALAKDPEDRYSSAGDLAADVQRYLNHEPLQARPANTLYFLTKHLQRNWKTWTAVACGVFLIGAGLARYFHKSSVFAQTESDLRQTLAVDASAAELRNTAGPLASGEIDEAYRTVAAAVEQDPDNLAAATLGGMLLNQTAHLLPLTQLPPHTDAEVVDVSFALKAPTYATSDGTKAQVYSEAGDQRSPALFQPSLITEIQLSPMGTLLATMHEDGTLAVWSAEDAWSTPKTLSGVSGDRLTISEDDRWLGWIDSEQKGQLWEWQDSPESVTPNTLAQRIFFGDMVSEPCKQLLFDPLSRYALLKQGESQSLLWNLEKGRIVAQTLEGGSGSMPAAERVYQFGQDGKRFLNFKNGAGLVLAYTLPESPLTSLAVLPIAAFENVHGFSAATFLPGDGNKVVRIGSREVTVTDLEDGQSLEMAPEGLSWPRTMAVSADGNTLAVTGTEVSVHVLEAGTGKAVISPIEYPWSIRSLALNGDGSRLVLFDVRGKLSVWDCRTGYQLGMVQTTIVGEGAVSFTESDQFILVTQPDGSTVAWRYTDRLLSPMVFEGRRPATAFTLSPDGHTMAVTSAPRHVHFVETLSGKYLAQRLIHLTPNEKRTIYNRYRIRREVAFHPNGKSVFLRPGHHDAQMFDLQGTPAGPFKKIGENYPSTLVDPIDGAFVCSITWQRVTVWDTQSGETLWESKRKSQMANVNASLSTRGSYFLVTTEIRGTRVWDLTTKDMVHDRALHHTHITDIAWSSNDSFLSTSAKDGEIKVLSTHDWKEQAVFGHRLGVSKLDFHPNKPLLLSSSLDGTVKIWDVEAGTGYGRSMPHEASVHWAEFSPDGNHLATACEDGTVRLWDTQTQCQISLPIRHPKSVEKVAFHPEGTHLITLCDDGKIRVWPIFIAPSSAPDWFPTTLRSVSGTSQDLPRRSLGTEEDAYEQLIHQVLKAAPEVPPNMETP